MSNLFRANPHLSTFISAAITNSEEYCVFMNALRMPPGSRQLDLWITDICTKARQANVSEELTALLAGESVRRTGLPPEEIEEKVAVVYAVLEEMADF